MSVIASLLIFEHSGNDSEVLIPEPVIDHTLPLMRKARERFEPSAVDGVEREVHVFERERERKLR